MTDPYSGSPTSSVNETGDYRIDALLHGQKWGGPEGTGTEITYSFPDSGSVWSTSYYEPGVPGYRGLNQTEQFYFAKALETWSDVANITVTEVADGADDVGDIRVAFSGSVADRGVAAWAYYPYSGANAGDIWINPDLSFANHLAPGGGAFSIFLHELGHALGLSHSFSGGMDGVLTGDEDSTQYSVMAYHNHDGFYPHTPMLYDILAMQHLYGANYATRADDTNYSFSATSDTLMAIWDGGGIDTLDASNQTLPVHISLTEGTFSSIGPGKYIGTVGTDNVAIAYGVVIENATGGSGSDTLFGNAVGNVLKGLGGNDVLHGLDGNDALYGGSGDDTLVGGIGDDFIEGGNGQDLVVFTDEFGLYSLSFDPDNNAVVTFTGPGSGSDGSDVVHDVEWFQFKDATHSRQDLLTLVGDSTPSNHAPNAVDDAAIANEDQSVTISVLDNDGDPDGDLLAISAVTQGSSGLVTVNAGGTVTYTPEANFHGADSFTYTVADGRGGTDAATVTVTVTPVNNAPIAADDSATTDQGQSVTLPPLANDSDPDGDELQLVSVEGASGGTVQIDANGSVTYTPNAGFTGDDTMTYTVRDPGGAQASASITVRVDPVEPVGEPDLSDGAVRPVTIPGTEGNDKLTGTGSDDVIDGYGGRDVIQGRSGDDVIRGSAGNDKIWGDYKGKNSAPGGNDSLYGGDGNDSILGQKGNDTIFGGAGDDTLKGQAGADCLQGGMGDDNLCGGGGGDRFVFAPGFGNDTISDFRKGADILDLAAFALGGFAAIDDDGDGRIETGEGGGAFSAFVGADTVLDFGGGNILTIQNAGGLGADDFGW